MTNLMNSGKPKAWKESAMTCQRCGALKSEHGPNMECPCVIYTDEGRSVRWNRCKFLGLEVVSNDNQPVTPARGSNGNEG